jgi:hypothetical protein
MYLKSNSGCLLVNRENTTVSGLRVGIKAAVQKANMINTGEKLFLALGPLPLWDIDGMGTEALKLLRTLDPGNTEATVQYSTAKSLTTALGALCKVSMHSKEETVTMVKYKLKCYLTTALVRLKWYKQFLNGMHKQMRHNIKQDEALLIEQMLALMEMFEDDWQKLAKYKQRILAGSCEVLFSALFLVVMYCGALCGEKAPLMDLESTRKFTKSGLERPKEKLRHAVIALHGQFEKEVGERCHLMPLVPDTDSGLPPKKWKQQMLEW